MGDRPSNLLTGPRLFELAIVALVSATLGGSIASWATRLAVQEQLSHQRLAIEELKAEVRALRDVIYRPAWPHGEPTMSAETAAALLVDLKASLHDAANYFHGTPESEEGAGDADPDSDFRRHLYAAAADLGERRGLTLIGEITLTPEQARYTGLPADMVYIKTPLWGTEKKIDIWADNYPGRLPRARLAYENGQRVLTLIPAPTQQQIQTLGNTYRFFYGASYWDGDIDANLNLEPADRALLLLRAQAEACRELALQNMTRTVETRTTLSQPSGQTPRSLWEALMAEYNRRLGVTA